MVDPPPSLSPVEEILGYVFRDRGLLEQALRHASYCNELPGERLGDNQRLEFLGDAVLALMVGQRLMMRFPDAHEGQLSMTRAQVVSEEGLSEVADKLGIGQWLLLGRGEERSGGRSKPKILADAFEAIIAAVYLDGGFEAARAAVDRLLLDRINAAEIRGFNDYKTRLQEAVQARMKMTPTYQVVQQLGPDHDKRFVVSVTIGSEEIARSIGRSKKEAEQIAAAEAHFRLVSEGRVRG